MEKRVLIVYYSQSGQLKLIAEKLAITFSNDSYDLEWLEVQPQKEFTFPWSAAGFFDAMPESVLGIPTSLRPLNFKRDKYDLIVFAYQPWFLSPSIPATSILHNKEFKKRLFNTPVVTLIGARNMWAMAQEKVKALLKNAGANLVGNIVLEDKHSNLLSAVSIQYWMFTGKKEKFLGIFPKPGVSDHDINSVQQYGKIVADALQNNTLQTLQIKLVQANAIMVRPNLLFIESRGAMIFSIWANIISKKKNRVLWLKIFKYYLVFGLFMLSPFLILIYMVFFRPLMGNHIKRKEVYYLRVN